jgi:hypothetical protein
MTSGALPAVRVEHTLAVFGVRTDQLQQYPAHRTSVVLGASLGFAPRLAIDLSQGVTGLGHRVGISHKSARVGRLAISRLLRDCVGVAES